ncbi:MAG: N-acetylmannosamine-6-phosphate 2-epimerase [Peptostreptococcaceae bacterium]|nr:N-acetylmannosamine-6-phosphate 2-epimerase [Peptostreptococcaceae bacterium]
MSKVEKIKGALVVSCQALEHEPLHSSFIMGRMALAAKEGGAKGIRANTVEDIAEIKKNTDLPIIGIIKKNYEGSDVYITPTMREVDDLVKAGVEIIAMHATDEKRPGGIGLEEFFREVKQKYPNQLFMADCSTVEEALLAEKLGFDFLGTTLVGYTKHSKGLQIEENDFEIIRDLLAKAKKPIIAEGNIDTPEKAKRVLDLGCYSVVVGSSITRPQLITQKYVNAINE